MTELRADIQAVVDRMNGKLTRSWGRTVFVIQENLEPDESVLCIAAGVRAGTVVTSERGLMVLTDRKVAFMHQGIRRSSQEFIPSI